MWTFPQILEAEHVIILRKLHELKRSSKAISFFMNTMPLHRQKEENFLFPNVMKHIPDMGWKISHLRKEHNKEKELLKYLSQAKSIEEYECAITLLNNLLHGHIADESKWFVLMDCKLPNPVRKQIVQQMLKIGMIKG